MYILHVFNNLGLGVGDLGNRKGCGERGWGDGGGRLNGDRKLDRTFAGGFLDKNVHEVSRCAETKNQKKSARRAA